jgi:ferrous iron transport protein A
VTGMINVSTASKDKKYVVKQIDIQNKKNMLYRLGAFGLNVGSKISIKQKCLFKWTKCC